MCAGMHACVWMTGGNQLCACVCVSLCVCVHVCGCHFVREAGHWESAFLFNMGSGDQTQVIWGLCGKCFYPLASPGVGYF